MAGEPPHIAVGLGDERVTVANAHGIVTIDRVVPPPAVTPADAPVDYPMPVWSADGAELILLGTTGTETVRWSSETTAPCTTGPSVPPVTILT
jgi:hypothetical protein